MFPGKHALGAALAALPAIGIALNGTSSVLYGTVPELAPADKRQRAFGLFYTLTIGAGALSPAMYGLVGDVVGIPAAMLLIAALVLVTLPLACRLSGFLNDGAVMTGRLRPKPRPIKERRDPHAVTGAASAGIPQISSSKYVRDGTRLIFTLAIPELCGFDAAIMICYRRQTLKKWEVSL